MKLKKLVSIFYAFSTFSSFILNIGPKAAGGELLVANCKQQAKPADMNKTRLGKTAKINESHNKKRKSRITNTETGLDKHINQPPPSISYNEASSSNKNICCTLKA